VVTTTASSILANVVIFVSTIVAMIILSWQLTIVAVITVPAFFWLTKTVGDRRRQVSRSTQEALAAMSAISEETLSVSGVLLAKVFGNQGRDIGRYRRENQRLADLEVRQQMIGQGFYAVVQVFLSITPAAIYLVTGLLLARAGDPEPGLRFEDRRWSWREHVGECARYAAALRARRSPGRPFHVGVLADNVPEFSFLLGGCAFAGAVLVALNPVRRGEALARDVARTDCQYVLAEPGYAALLPHLEKDEALARAFFKRLRLIFYAGAALPQDLWERLEAVSVRTTGERVPMTSSWGTTETAPLAVAAQALDQRRLFLAAHAVIDALLGAAGLGDIGKHFPDTDPMFAGADSRRGLRRGDRRVRGG